MINKRREPAPAQQPALYNPSATRPLGGRSHWGGGRSLRWLIGALALLVGAWLVSQTLLPRSAQATSHDPIAGAWAAARTVGAYAFTSDIRQVTIPTARVTNVGRSSKHQTLHLEGQTDLEQELLEMTLWTEGGSVAQPNSGVGVKVEKGQSYIRQGDGAWQAADNLLEGIAPGGDFLAFLTAVRAVQVGDTEQRAGINFTRYRFTLDGPTLAAHLRQQTEAALRRQGELPPGINLESSPYYRDMIGDGELWVRSDGLPLRQILNLQFPEQRDEYVNTQITTDFFGFGQSTPIVSGGGGSGIISQISHFVRTGTPIGLMLLAGLGLFFVVLRYRRTRPLYNGLAIAVILSMVIGPVLATTLHVRFFDAQSAKAAAQQETTLQNDIARDLRTQLGAPEFNAHQNPLESGEQRLEITRLESWKHTAQSPNLVIAQSPNLQSTDNGADSDTDGLTDFQEQRIGTDAKFADSDEDGVDDNSEVRGFALGGQTWYANPLESDSNHDGVSDTTEFDNDGNGAPDDTDSDNIPDLFDFDNDNDGVPDNKDLAPFAFTGAGVNTPFSEGAPLKLTVNNVAAGKPTFVDFQVRPTDPKRLWYAFNVLDWPSDSVAQMQDIDGKTFADMGGTAANDANGDLKLIPMLEIRINGAATNLPPQRDLTPYNITVNNFNRDGSIKTVMVPLNVITDEKTGQRVAFSGRMLYLPGGSWPSAHDVRLSWVVQGLSDVSCDKTTDKSADCQADGRLNNQPYPLQTYYDSFTLTGLSVQEDNGSSVAIIYEDPAVDPNQKDDGALVALSHGLDNSFLGGRDQDGDTRRDVTLDEIARRFDRAANGNVSTIERWSVPNVLRVEKASYPTNDQALITTAMTETKRILNNIFTPSWQTDKGIKPLLMYAQEQTLRGLDFDAIRTPGGYVTANGGAITFDFQPSGQPPVTRDTMASLKWTPFCAPDAAAPTWDACANDVYWTELDTRYRTNNVAGDPDLAEGRLAATQIYFFALIGSVARVVQRDVRVVSGRYSLKTDTELETYVRIAGLVVGEIVAELASQALMARFVNKETMLQGLGREVKEIFEGKVGQLGKDAIDILRAFRDGGNYNRAAGTAIVVGATAVLAGLVTGGFFLADAFLSSDPQANLGAKITVRILVVAITIYLTAIVPLKAVYEWHQAYKAAGVPLRATATIGTAAAKASAVGVLVPVALTWGFFIYSMVSGQVSAFSPAFNEPFAEAIATTLYVILLFVFSLTIIGTIIVAIVAIIDTILTAICVLGVDALRTVPGLGGACFTLGTAAIKVLAYLLYNFDPMVDTERDDLVVAGAPQVTLADPNKGYVAGQTLSVRLPVTTTVVHKDPDPANGLMIFFYLYLYSPNNLRQSTFRYSLTQDALPLTVAGGQMVNEWQGVREDHKFVLTPMYRGQKADNPTPLNGLTLQAGLDKTVPFHLNMGYAVPGYECWLILIVPVCYTRKDGLVGNNSTPINDLKFDVFPATIDGFMSLTDRSGGLALAWDNRFPPLADADGDGLLATVRYGIDPNDALPDADGDGLSDSFELERRQAGIALSPILRDSDGDGLTDKQEMDYGTNAGVADTDNDGLSDGQELWHQVYDANGVATSTFEGGWDVTINGASNILQRVSSNPNQADGDADGLSDQAERQLALDANPTNRLDNQNRPYHPNVPNAPPLAVYAASNDADGFVRPGQPVIYTTTVVANTALAPGVLQVTAPQLGAAPGSQTGPYALAFNPATFAVSQTVTQQSNLIVANNAAAGALNLSSTALVRLPNTSATAWTLDPVVAEAPLGGFVDPVKARFHSLNPSRIDRQDSYFLSGLVGPSTVEFSTGDIRTYGLPAGTTTVVENSAINISGGGNRQFFLRGFTAPDSAVNNRNESLVVWDRIDRCNTITLNSLRVVTAGADDGSGIEPFIALSTNENLWLWTTGGGTADMTSGQQRGPNAFGFPITRTICGDARLRVYESDGPLTDPAQQQLVAEIVTDPFIDRNNQTLTFSGAGHTIEVNVTVPVRDAFVIGGAFVGSDGVAGPKLSLSRPTGLPVNYKTVSRSPAVASNGDGFLVAYETYAEPYTPPGNNPPLPRDVYVAVQAFDGSGNLLGSSVRFVATQNPTQNSSTRSGLDVAWVGDRYKVVVQPWGREWVVAGDFSATGASLGGWANVDQLFGNTTLTSPPNLAYNPANGRWAVAYVRAPSVGLISISVVEYANAGSMTETARRQIFLDGGNFKQAKLVYHPPSRAWLMAGLDDSNQLRFYPLQAGLADLTASQAGLAGASTVDSSLACPAAQASPTVDLRFEELPGTTSFADASGGNNNATCTGASCPAAGVDGAPNAPLSDYAVQFDGGDDFLTLNRAMPDSFTVAFWLKAPPAAAPDMILVDQGANQSGGFTLWLSNGRPGLLLNTAESIVGSGRIDDNQWHFVAATRNRSTGAVALYVDGNPTPVAGNIFAATALNAVTDIRIGGDRSGNRDFQGAIDHLQIFPVALGGDIIQAIYNRTMQSYCVAAHANADQSGFQWARLTLRQQDVRGGRITASGGLSLTVDTDAPIASVTAPPNNSYIQGGNPLVTIIGGSASDLTAGVGQVEVNVNNGGWQLATGDEAWSYPLAVTEGAYTIQARATDAAGTVGAPSPAITIIADATAPDLTLNDLGTTPMLPTRNGAGQWTVNLAGTVSDPARAGQPGSGLAANGVEVFVESSVMGSLPNSRQTATIAAPGEPPTWSLAYVLNDVADPTGIYTITVTARDNVGNRTAEVRGRLLLDGSAPVVSLSQTDAVNTVISRTVTISGLVTDTGTIPGSSAGIDQVEIAFTPAEQIAALPAGLIGDAAETQLTRTWVAVTLVQRGAGVATSRWSYPIPAGLEGEYQIDFRSTDMLGNRRITPNVWRGMIDTTDPRLVMTAAATGASFIDSSGVRRYEVRFVCAAVDRNLDEATFVCLGEGQAEPTRTFADIPGLQSLFPDLTIRNGLAISYTLWSSTATSEATVRACDSLGRCASASTPNPVNGVVADPTEFANASEPQALIIAPIADSFVAATSGVSVTVAAVAGAALKEVTIRLDNTVVQTLTFAQDAAIMNTQRTVTIPVANEGPHTLVAQATDWTGAAQTTLFPVTFTLDTAPPSLAIDASTLTVADTWQPESGILRFNGTADDTIGLAAVQVSVDDGAFVDAAFANGAWQTALHVQAPEGRTLTLTVRASDHAGRTTEITQAIGTDLSAADAPDTSIDSGPANPSPENVAIFGFTGTANAVAFDCQLDDGAYLPCVSPTSYADLSKGAHTLRVRAIDERGFADITPAEVVWTVAASALDVTLTQTPENPTTSRHAEFHFTGNGAGFQCSLDDAEFGPCTSPQGYSTLKDGKHTFLVRAINDNGVGTAARFGWTVQNGAPVAASQQVTTSVNHPLPITLNASDEDTLTYRVITPPAHGVLLDAAPTLSYVPDSGYSGTDSFTFSADDGLASATPATVYITIQAATGAEPDTIITAKPTDPTVSRTASFAFTAGAGISLYACSLDSAAFAPCTSPITYSELALGSHTFAVRASSELGVVESTPATFSWTVNEILDGTSSFSLFLPLVAKFE